MRVKRKYIIHLIILNILINFFCDCEIISENEKCTENDNRLETDFKSDKLYSDMQQKVKILNCLNTQKTWKS